MCLRIKLWRCVSSMKITETRNVLLTPAKQTPGQLATSVRDACVVQ